jgi:hypothetical protein
MFRANGINFCKHVIVLYVMHNEKIMMIRWLEEAAAGELATS